MPISSAPGVEEALRDARIHHPAFVTDEEDFARLLCGLVTDAPGIESLAVADLYVAHACAHGCTTALAVFETELRASVPALRRMSLSPQQIDDTLQAVRTELLVAESADEAKVLRYSGRAQLRSWLRAVAVRLAMRSRPDLRHDEYEDAVHGAESDDLELAFMKRKFGAAFEAAFSVALGKLTVGDRLLLKQRYRYRVGVVDLARVHGVSNGTISKRVTNARGRLVEEIRDAMTHALGLASGEVSSVLRLIESQVEITFSDIT